jgi:nucleoside-diphosphate-sugar epimerase
MWCFIWRRVYARGRRPIRTIETNIKGTELALESAAKKNSCSLPQPRKSMARACAAPFRNGRRVIGSCCESLAGRYATSKFLDEFLALAYGKEKQPSVVIDPLNTVGP